MMNIFHKLKPKGVPVLAFLLALVMLIGLIPFTATEVHAVEVDPTAEGTEPFTGDFTLELWNTEDTSKHETHQMTHNGNDWNVAKTDILPATAFAYTGNGVTVTSPGNYSVELTEDQSTEDAFNAADVMIATGEATKDTKLDLNFSHYHAKVTFKITRAREFEDTDAIKNLYVVTKDNYVPEVVAYNSATNEYSAYVTAGTYSGESNFVKIEIGEYTGDNKLVAKMPTEKTIEAGKHYTFDLKVGQNKVEIEAVAVDESFPSGWNDEVNLDGSTGTIGIADAGKNAWENGDQVLAFLESNKYGKQSETFTYGETGWTQSGETVFQYLENETLSVTAVYAPSSTLGMGEYISATCEIKDGVFNVSFDGTARNYSRLRIVGEPGQQVKAVTTGGFIPAGATENGTYSYDLTFDANGNAFLYGSFATVGTVSVTDIANGAQSMRWTFNEPTIQQKSYVLNTKPIIDGTLGGKTIATNDDVYALEKQLSTYVQNGFTEFTVTGSKLAMTESGTRTALGEAIYRMSGHGTHEDSHSFNGSINLILPDVTEIADEEFYCAFALNSINLPKVTSIGNMAFYNCFYLEKITFGSVVTKVVGNESDVFGLLGRNCYGCHLVLNCGQLQAEDNYKPNLENNEWYIDSNGYATEWESITLTHTGENSECDECKAMSTTE